MDEVPGSFTIAFVAGVTLTRWTRAWEERQRRIPLAFLPTDAQSQVSALHDGHADVSFVRLPVDRTGLSIIPLYDEVPVVLVPKEHPIAAFDTVTLKDLVSEDRVAETLSTEDAVELVAAGGGIVILPQSIARLHTRKDLVARAVTDADGTSIAIAWLEERTTPRVEEFVGIVRGRTAASSRAVPTPKTPRPKTSTSKTTSKTPSKTEKLRNPAAPRGRSHPRKPRGR